MKKIFTFFAAALMSVSLFADPNIVTPTISGDTEFTDSVIVTMSCPSPDADIYYTIDGVTDPKCDCPDAPEYREPIVIRETTTIKAAAYDGNDWSDVAEVTFTKKEVPADPNREYISLDPSVWGWGYNSVSEAVEGGLQTTVYSDWGAVSTGWDPIRDLSEWDKIVFEVSHMDGCDGEWFKLKAYLRDESESEGNQMEGMLGLDAPDNELNYLVIDLHQDKACDITKARILAVQCQPTGATFTISSVYLLKEEAPKYHLTLYVNDSTMGSVELVNAFKHTGPLEELEPLAVYEVAEGDTVILRATANEGFEFKEWKYANESNPEWTAYDEELDELTFVMTEDVEIMAEFAEKSEGIENIVLTEKAQKVLVDGVLYIVRDNKLFNVQGAQVK